MRQIRVLLVDLPRMLRDILTKLFADHHDLTLVGEVQGLMGFIGTVGETRADVIVLGLPSDDIPAECDQLLQAYPGVAVLALVDDGRRGLVYRLMPQRIPLGEIAPRTLVDAIRLAAPPARQTGPAAMSLHRPID